VTDTRWQLLAYVFASIVLRMVAAQLWRRRTSIGWVRFLSEGWAASILRLAYYIGLPYAALVLGVAPGRYLGLVGPNRWQTGEAFLVSFPQGGPIPKGDLWVGEPGLNVGGLVSWLRNYLSLVLLSWLPDLGRLLGLAALLVGLLSVVWLGYGFFRRWVLADGLKGWQSGKLSLKNLSALQVFYQAVHWSFYRSAIWLLTDDPYLGMLGGIVLVGGEWLLASGWPGATHPLGWEERLLDASVLIATFVIFFFVPNLWLLLPVHWLLAMASRRTTAWEQWQGFSRVG
jgi:hypothetical protein